MEAAIKDFDRVKASGMCSRACWWRTRRGPSAPWSRQHHLRLQLRRRVALSPSRSPLPPPSLHVFLFHSQTKRTTRTKAPNTQRRLGSHSATPAARRLSSLRFFVRSDPGLQLLGTAMTAV